MVLRTLMRFTTVYFYEIAADTCEHEVDDDCRTDASKLDS